MALPKLVSLPQLQGLFQTCRWRCGWQCFENPSNTSDNETFEGVVASALTRRTFLKQAVAGAFVLVAAPQSAIAQTPVRAPDFLGTFADLDFTPVALSTEDRLIVPPGYTADVVMRWGDPVLPDAPPFELARQSARAQRAQFGYNSDFVAFMPLPASTRSSDHGLLYVNHEYTNPELMFPGYNAESPTREQIEIEIAAHGASVVEIQRDASGPWKRVGGSRRNFRITGDAPHIVTGPAAGHPLLRTREDATGTRVRGTFNDCGGGKTPWGTVLMGEENFHSYFANAAMLPSGDRRTRWHTRYGLPAYASQRRWELAHERFDLAKEPNEPFRHGWVVEVDPYDPNFVPRKRTALGRMKHEAATIVVAKDGRVVAYTGDDERFEYAYKFVSTKPFRRADRPHNLTVLDEGTLYVARFRPDGTGDWLPLVQGHGPLVASNGFENQGDVLINVRGAADLVGATKMDRPEDIEANPITGYVYMVMTNNTQRTAAQVDRANPRPNNRDGHIIELVEADQNATSTTFTWSIFMLAGDPANESTNFADFPRSRMSAISSPDNIAFDRRGNLWIATDGQPGTIRRNDGIYVVPVGGPNRGYLRQFLSAPIGAEVCGPEFTPDNRTLFCAIQHPGEGGTVEKPAGVWPDGNVPARPAVVALRRTNGQVRA